MTPNTGKRRRVTIEGEHWYVIVTGGPDGPAVDITCPRENALEHAKLRGQLEMITGVINDMLTEAQHAA